LYGEDGIDATYMEGVEIVILKKNAKELEEEYNNGIVEEFDNLKKKQLEFIEIASYREPNNFKLDDCYYPMAVNIQRILVYARTNVKSEGNPVEPNVAYKEVCGLCKRLDNVFNFEDIKLEDIKYSEKYRASNATKLFTIYVYSELASKKIKDLNYEQLIYVIEEIELKFRKAIVTPGEMVGILAAQSIGEPA